MNYQINFFVGDESMNSINIHSAIIIAPPNIENCLYTIMAKWENGSVRGNLQNISQTQKLGIWI